MAELSSLIREVVQPGYRRLAQTLSELAAGARDDDGVWKHPDGEAYYHWALRWHTTTNQGPEEIHQIGLAEIERYIVAPGQACAYKMGQLKILELRARAKGRLGDDFDLRAFNDLVLAGGALPLAVLDQVVTDWIEESAGSE